MARSFKEFLSICLIDPGWQSPRAVTPSVLRVAAAAGHILPLGLYDDNQAGHSPPPL